MMSFHVGRINKVGVPDLYRGVPLLVQRALEISVLRHLKTHFLVLSGPRPCCDLMVAHPRLLLELQVVPNLRLWSGPFELIGMIFHFPLAPDSGFEESIELSLGVGRFWEIGVDVCLFDMFESGLCVSEHGSVAIVFAIVEALGSGHPVRNVLAVAAT